MKMTTSQKVHYESGPNMTPLVDVVMVILIFLMLTGSFGAVAKFLPAAGIGGGPVCPPSPVPPPPSLDVLVSSPTPETFVARIGGGNEVYGSAEALGAALAAKRAAHVAAGSGADQVQVQIRPRASTAYEHVLAAYEAALTAQWPRVGFAIARE